MADINLDILAFYISKQPESLSKPTPSQCNKCEVNGNRSIGKPIIFCGLCKQFVYHDFIP